MTTSKVSCVIVNRASPQSVMGFLFAAFRLAVFLNFGLTSSSIILLLTRDEIRVLDAPVPAVNTTGMSSTNPFKYIND
jgi:hypothetical protein